MTHGKCCPPAVLYKTRKTAIRVWRRQYIPICATYHLRAGGERERGSEGERDSAQEKGREKRRERSQREKKRSFSCPLPYLFCRSPSPSLSFSSSLIRRTGNSRVGSMFSFFKCLHPLDRRNSSIKQIPLWLARHFNKYPAQYAGCITLHFNKFYYTFQVSLSFFSFSIFIYIPSSSHKP